MSNFYWNPTNDQILAICLMEVAGLFHDLGKFSDSFIKKQSMEVTNKIETSNYDYRLIVDPRQVFPSAHGISRKIKKLQESASDSQGHGLFGIRSDLTDIFQNYSFYWSNEHYALGEILVGQFVYREFGKICNKSGYPAELMRHNHRIAHFAKENTPDQNKQRYRKTYLSSPFGNERLIPLDHSADSLNNLLNQLPLLKINDALEPTKRYQWLLEIKNFLTKGIAHSARPSNDVSLWDWGYIVSSLVKASVVYIMMKGIPSSIDNLPFRTLSISFDRIKKYSLNTNISDVLGIRSDLDKCYKQVQQEIETIWTMGNCIYSDETGAYYLLPDIMQNDDANFEYIKDKIRSQFPVDLQPEVHIGEAFSFIVRQPVQSILNSLKKCIIDPRQKSLHQKKEQLEDSLTNYKNIWTDKSQHAAELCPVCGIHPVGYPEQENQSNSRPFEYWATTEKAISRKLCRQCLERRGRRSQEWANYSIGTTIWTNEVADNTGRLALFTGQLGLDGWLSGHLFSTILVNDDDANNITTKNPSPTRLYRIAEAGREFWQEVQDKITPTTTGRRPFRLALYPPQNTLFNVGNFHACELDVDGIMLSVVWDKPNNRFITSENLAYFFSRWFHESADRKGEPKQDNAHNIEYEQDFIKTTLVKRLQHNHFHVTESPDGSALRTTLDTIKIEMIDSLEGYSPSIPIIAEPGICMILIPADKALSLCNAIRNAYEIHMGKVRDRLPLKIGLIFFSRRTPIRAVLEAGHSMASGLAKDFDNDSRAGWENWGVESNDCSTHSHCGLEFENSIIWNISVLTGDDAVHDKWYPRMYTGADWDSKESRNVRELKTGDKIWVRPSLFDFEFLDKTGRRFEIFYDNSGKRSSRPSRPYYLEDIDRLEVLWRYCKKLNKSQIYQIIHAIEEARELWHGQDFERKSMTDSVFKTYVRDTLSGAEWPWENFEEKWQERLVEAGVKGELTDIAELHMKILSE